MADVGMDQVLEAVADAVAQLVLFSVEAEENNSMLPNIVPGAEAVQRAVNVLVDIALEMASKFGSEKALQDKMYEVGTSIRSASTQIVEDARALGRDQFNQNAKKSLLLSAKNILQGTIKELHLADKYEVIKIVKAATQCKEHIERSNEVSAAEQIMDIARTLSSAVVALVKLVNARLLLLVDPILKRRLETANNTMKNETQGLVKAMGEALRNLSDPTLRANQRKVARELQEALDEIILVAKLSCKTMFDSLDLDFGADFSRPSLRELREAHEKICRECDNLNAAVSRNNAEGAATSLFQLNTSVGQEVKIAGSISEEANDIERRNILEACDNVERMPALITPSTKAALTRGAPLSAKDRLQSLTDDTKAASAAVLAACILASSPSDKLREVTDALMQHLRELEEGVADGDKGKAARAARAVADDSAMAVTLGRSMADVSDNPISRDFIRDDASRMEEATPHIFASTKAALADPSNAQLLRKLHDDANALRNASDRLNDSTSLDPAELLRKRTQELEDELRKLEEAIRNGNLQDAARHLKAAKDLIADNLRLAERLAAECEDPVRKAKLEAAIARLRELDRQLVPLAKAALSGDKDAQEKLRRLIEELDRVAEAIADASRPSPEEALRKNMRNVDEALDRLQDALDRGDVPSARTAARDVSQGLDRDTQLLDELSSAESDPHRRRELAAVRQELDRLKPIFAGAADRAILSPSDAGARDALDAVSHDIKDAHTDITRQLPTPEERMTRLARDVAANLERLERATDAGDKTAATDAVKAVVRDIGALVDTSGPIANASSDPFQRDRIVSEAATLKGLAPSIVQSTKSALENPRDKNRQRDVENASDNVQTAAEGLARAAALSPDQNIADNAAHINARLNEVIDGAARGDRPAVHKTNRRLESEVPAQIDFVKAYADRQNDPLYQRTVQQNADELSRLIPQIRDASSRAAASPSDHAAQRDLADLVDRAKAANNALVPDSSSPEQRILGTTAAVANELGRVVRAVEGRDRAEADAALRALKDAAAQQTDTARLIANDESDADKRRQIEDAIRDLERLIRDLPNSAASALADPSALPRLRNDANKAQQANARIAELTVKPTDEQLVDNAKRLHRDLDNVDRSLASKEAVGPALREMQKSLARHKALTKDAAAKESDPDRKAKLQRALAELEEVDALLPEAARNAAANPKNAAAVSRAKQLIKQGHDATDQTVQAVTPTPRHSLLSAYFELSTGLNDMPPAIAHQSPQERDDASKRYNNAVSDLNRIAPVLAREDPRNARPIAQAAERLNPALANVNDTAGKAFSSPRDNNRQKDLGDASSELSRAGGELVVASSKDIPNEILDNAIFVDDALDRLAAAVRRGNRQDAVDALKDAQDGLRRQAALARALAAKTSDPRQKKALEDAADEAEKAARDLEPATNRALAFPNDREAQQAFNEAVQAAKVANASVVAAAHPNGEQNVIDAGKRLADNIRAITKATKEGNKDEALRLLDELERDMRRQGALCRALAIKSTDPNKRKLLLEAAMALQNCIASLLGPLRDAIKSGDSSALDILSRLLAETEKSNKALQSIGKQKSPLLDEDEPNDEIMRAARRVENVVQAKIDAHVDGIDESTAEGRIYAVSRRIAQEMAAMSEAAARGANSEVIIIARRINTHIQSLSKDSQEIASMCKDPHLRDQVLSTSQAISNIAVQLKVITAVKAASASSGDTSVKAQLVTCARNLATSVVSLCNGTEIASIRFG